MQMTNTTGKSKQEWVEWCKDLITLLETLDEEQNKSVAYPVTGPTFNKKEEK